MNMVNDYKTFLSALTEQIRNLLVIKLNNASSELSEVSFKSFIDLPENEIQDLTELINTN